MAETPRKRLAPPIVCEDREIPRHDEDLFTFEQRSFAFSAIALMS
jgi:hypothetical protein